MRRLAMCMRTARSPSSVLRSFSVSPMLSDKSIGHNPSWKPDQNDPMNKPVQQAPAPQQPTSVSTAEGEVHELKKKLDKLQTEMDEICKLARIKLASETPGFVENPITGVISYNGDDPDWKQAFARLAKLEKEYEVCDPCFAHPLLILSSMTRSQHVCVGVAIVGTGDAQCDATLLIFCFFFFFFFTVTYHGRRDADYTVVIAFSSSLHLFDTYREWRNGS